MTTAQLTQLLPSVEKGSTGMVYGSSLTSSLCGITVPLRLAATLPRGALRSCQSLPRIHLRPNWGFRRKHGATLCTGSILTRSQDRPSAAPEPFLDSGLLGRVLNGFNFEPLQWSHAKGFWHGGHYLCLAIDNVKRLFHLEYIRARLLKKPNLYNVTPGTWETIGRSSGIKSSDSGNTGAGSTWP
jgi:hypothetical protein